MFHHPPSPTPQIQLLMLTTWQCLSSKCLHFYYHYCYTVFLPLHSTPYLHSTCSVILIYLCASSISLVTVNSLIPAFSFLFFWCKWIIPISSLTTLWSKQCLAGCCTRKHIVKQYKIRPLHKYSVTVSLCIPCHVQCWCHYLHQPPLWCRIVENKAHH